MCIVCDKKIKPNQKRYMLAFDGYTVAMNIYIHRKCNVKSKIEKALKDEEKTTRIINFEV
jgi:hypothetical protein